MTAPARPAVALPRPAVADVVIALALWLVAGVMVPESFGERWAGGAVLGFSLLFTIPLFWRTTAADVAAAGVALAHVVQLVAAPHPVMLNITVPMVMHAVAAHGREEFTRPWLYAGLASSVVAGARWGLNLEAEPSRSIFAFVFLGGSCAAVVAAAWFMGALNRQRIARLRADRERAVAEQREQVQAVRLASTQERQRLAREMHDIIAHSLSVIVVQADGARYVASDAPGDAEARLERVAQAIETIQATARQALGETRRLVGVLHADSEDPDAVDLAPAARLDDIRGLVDNLVSAGRTATLSVVGDPEVHAPLGSVGELTAYRIVQESLTNIIKHAGPDAAAHVLLTHEPAGVGVSVRDDGPGSTAGDGRGHGHLGMRERVQALGGTLTLRNHPEGGFEVAAFLPTHDPRRTP